MGLLGKILKRQHRGDSEASAARAATAYDDRAKAVAELGRRKKRGWYLAREEFASES